MNMKWRNHHREAIDGSFGVELKTFWESDRQTSDFPSFLNTPNQSDTLSFQKGVFSALWRIFSVHTLLGGWDRCSLWIRQWSKEFTPANRYDLKFMVFMASLQHFFLEREMKRFWNIRVSLFPHKIAPWGTVGFLFSRRGGAKFDRWRGISLELFECIKFCKAMFRMP